MREAGEVDRWIERVAEGMPLERQASSVRRQRGENPSLWVVRAGRTDICIEGCPRSANSFAVRMFSLANPDAVVAHHTHSSGNLKRAVKLRVPAIVLIREPVDAILSSLVWSAKEDVDEDMFRYVLFYGWVREHLDALVVAEFKTVTTNFNRVIAATNERFGTSFNELADVDSATRRVFADIERRYAREGLDRVGRLPLPVPERNEVKQRARSRGEAHPMAALAREQYDRIVAQV